MNRIRGIIEKTIEDVGSINTVLSLVAFEGLEPEELRAVARGGFEMTGRLQRDLEHVLPSFPGSEPTTDADGVQDTPPQEEGSTVELLEALLRGVGTKLDYAHTSLSIALYNEELLDTATSDAIARCALETLFNILENDLFRYAPDTLRA